MFGRYVACLPPGFAVTAALLFLMQQLVDAPLELPPSGSQHPFTLRPVALPPPPPPTVKPRAPDRIRPPVATPGDRIPVEPDPEVSRTDGPRGHQILPPIETGSGLDALPANEPLVCIVRVQPRYPAAGVTRGIDGRVTVEFDVLADGRVANARVVESTDRVFDRPALQAVARFRYRPRVVDGQAVVTERLRTAFRFEIEDAAN